MTEQEIAEEINRGYVCPPDAGPAWRAAYEAGLDMAALEHALTLTPDERLDQHEQVVNFLLEIKGMGQQHAAE